MSNRSVKFAPALLAGVVAAANVAATTDLRAQVIAAAEAAMPATQAVADSCLSAPQGTTPSGKPLVLSDRPRHQTAMLVSPGGERYGRRQVRTRRTAGLRAGFGSRGAGSTTATIDHTQVDRRRTCRMGLPADPRRAEPAARIEPRAVAAVAAPAVQYNSPRATMTNVLAPAPLSSMRWNDAPVVRASANPTDLQFAAANPPAGQLPQAAEVQLTAVDQAAPAAAEPRRRRQSRRHRCRSCLW
jgi:hypothetical protein